jgi:tetratricopeptide (TPR) repeat protein
MAQGEPLPKAITQLRSAASLDPQFAFANRLLTCYLLYADELEEAGRVAKRALEVHPDNAGSHFGLGFVYLFRGVKSLACEEFLEALRLDPNDLECYLRLGELYLQQDRPQDASEVLSKASALAPHDALGHSYLAVSWCRLRQEKKALAELRLAERYDSGQDLGVQQRLAEAYDLLADLPAALEHLEHFLRAARDRGVRSSNLAEVESKVADLKKRLAPHFIPIPSLGDTTNVHAPTPFTLLAKNKGGSVNPLGATSAMRAWAEQLSQSALTDAEKAVRIFQGLTRDAAIRAEGTSTHWLSAEESFKHWADPAAGMNCHDYALLYVALARAVGLKAFYVLVEKDYLGRSVPHACAGVVFEKRALLIDPTYRWFGVPHKEYEFESDERVTALCLAQSDNLAREDASLKLCPDWASLHFWITLRRAGRGQLQEARAALSGGLKQDKHTWLAEYAQGVVALSDNKLLDAVAHLRASLTLNPSAAGARYSLGCALARLGKLVEARSEFHAYLEGETEPAPAAAAREAIAYINEKESQ